MTRSHKTYIIQFAIRFIPSLILTTLKFIKYPNPCLLALNDLIPVRAKPGLLFLLPLFHKLLSSPRKRLTVILHRIQYYHKRWENQFDVDKINPFLIIHGKSISHKFFQGVRALDFYVLYKQHQRLVFQFHPVL